MSGAEIAGVVLGAIGASVAVAHVWRPIWRRLQEERRWHCAFGGRLRYVYHEALMWVPADDGEMVNITSYEEDDAPIDWPGEWVECNRLCNASRSGICRENPIFTRHVLKVLLGAMYPYIPLRPRFVWDIKWISAEGIAIGYPHPVTGKYSPTTRLIISRYPEERAAGANNDEDQPGSQPDAGP